MRLKIICLTIFLLPCLAVAQRYSADGDTLYMGEKTLVKAEGKGITNGQPGVIGTALTSLTNNTEWGPEIRLTHILDDTLKGFGSDQYFSITGDTIFLAFCIRDGITHRNLSMLMTSYDGGDSWSDMVDISNNNWLQTYYNFIAYRQGILAVAGSGIPGEWYNLVSKRSENAGLTWDDYHQFFPYPQQAMWMYPGTSMADSIFLIYYLEDDWRQRRIDTFYVVSSFDFGLTWQPSSPMFQPLRGVSIFPVSRYISGRLHFVYERYNYTTDTLEEVFYRYSDNRGLHWSEDIPISDMGIEHSQWPYLSGDVNGNLLISWFDYKYGSGGGGFTGDILYRRSTDNGDSWGPETRLTNQSTATYSCSYVDGNHIGIVWVDHRGSFLATELYYAETFDGGSSWTSELRLTDAPNSSDLPSVGIQGNKVYLFWQDARNGDLFSYEEYFRVGDVNTSIEDNPGVQKPDNFSVVGYPNPFNSSIMLNTLNNKGGEVKYSIYDVTGKLVNEVSDKTGKAIWDGTSFSGEIVSTGVYFISARNLRETAILKVLFLK